MKKYMCLSAFVFGTILSFAAMAETKTYVCGENCTATLNDDGVLRISGTGAMYDHTQTPYTLTTNAPWCDDRTRITSLIVENGITSVGRSAFKGFPLQNVELASSVQVVKYGAFDEIGGISSIIVSSTTQWQSQEDMYNTDNITLYCRGDLNACKDNFLANQDRFYNVGVAVGPRENKRIYTIEEARQAVEAAGTDTVNFRIRYK